MTTTEQPGGEVERISVAPLIRAGAEAFAAALPRHIGAERYQRWCLTFLKQAVAGKQAAQWTRVLASPIGQQSLMSAFMDCAALGLEPGRTYHFVPFGELVSGITDYKGEIELIFRAGPFPVVAQLVRKADEFRMVGANVPPRHEADWFGERGEITGGYSYCQLGPQSYTQVVLMSEDEFQYRLSKIKGRGESHYEHEWPEQWRLKTLVHQLRKWAPWSTEIQVPRPAEVTDAE